MDPMTMMLATTALSGGLSFMSGLGQKQSTAKQNRLQMIENARMDELNQSRLEVVNQKNEALGREMLTIPEVTTGWSDMRGLVEDAEAAGFNPLSVLRAGGLSLYAGKMTTGHNAADAFKLMSPSAQFGTPTTIQREPSMLEVVGSAGNAALSTFQSGYKTMQAQDFQMMTLDRQLAAIAQAGGNRSLNLAGNGTGGLYVPMTGGGGLSGAGGGTAKSGGLSDLPYPQKWTNDDVKVTNPHNMWPVDRTQADAEYFEQRYGDVFQELFGASNLVHDTVRAATGKSIREWGQTAGLSYNYPNNTAWYDRLVKNYEGMRLLDNYAKSLTKKQ